jgi:hypothetical protein
LTSILETSGASFLLLHATKEARSRQKAIFFIVTKIVIQTEAG